MPTVTLSVVRSLQVTNTKQIWISAIFWTSVSVLAPVSQAVLEEALVSRTLFDFKYQIISNESHCSPVPLVFACSQYKYKINLCSLPSTRVSIFMYKAAANLY